MNAKEAREKTKLRSYAKHVLSVNVIPSIKRRVSMGYTSEAFYFDGSTAISKDSRVELKQLVEDLGYKVNDNGFLFLVKWNGE